MQASIIVDERAYDYDAAGNITARTGTPGDQHYNYDALNRLTGQDISADSKNWQYDYGPNHNRQSRKDGGLLEELYTYQSDTNRLTEIDKLLGQRDPATPSSRQFIYNQANRFTEYVEDGQPVASYTYNALGQRTRKELGSENTLFHYDIGIQLLAETNGVGDLQKDYLWLGTRPLAQIESTGQVTYLYTDHLLTPRIGTSDAQNIVWQWEGEAFGDAEAQAVTEVALRFPGQYFDSETGRYYNNFRDYIPSFGRYMQSDPIGLEGGYNNYSYARANSLTYIDEKGDQASSPNTGGSKASTCAYYAAVGSRFGCKYHSFAFGVCMGENPGVEIIMRVAFAKRGEVQCIRRCLVREDKKSRRDSNCRIPAMGQCESSDSRECTKKSCIKSYHRRCYTECGVSPFFFGGNVFSFPNDG